jgi:hypothetical protein
VEVEYSLTPEDFLALARFRRRRKTQPAARWPGLVLAGLLVLLYVLARAAPGVPAQGFLPGLGVGVFSALALSLLVVVLALRLQKTLLKDPRNQWLFATRRITLSQEGLSIISWFARFFYRWEVVSNIGVTPGHVFLFLTSTDAAVVPRRAFRDQQHCEEFVALARRYQQGAAPPTGVMDALPAEAPPRPTTIMRAPE